MRGILNHKQSGTSLIELAVVTFLFLIVLGLTSNALSSGVRNFLSVRSEIELQQDAIVILSKLSREVGEASGDSTWPVPAPNTPLVGSVGEPVGIVFDSPRDNAGHMVLDPSTSTPLWQRRVCYFYDQTQNSVVRCDQPLPAPSTSPPGVDPTKTVSWFRDNRPNDPLPGRIESFSIQVGDSPESFNFDIQVSSESLGRKTTVQFVGHATMRG